jgi:hypothetical protein
VPAEIAGAKAVENVKARVVMVDPGIEPLVPSDHQIDLHVIEGAGAGGGAKRHPASWESKVLGDSRGIEEEPGQSLDGER